MSPAQATRRLERLVPALDASILTASSQDLAKAASRASQQGRRCRTLEARNKYSVLSANYLQAMQYRQAQGA